MKDAQARAVVVSALAGFLYALGHKDSKGCTSLDAQLSTSHR